MQAQAVGNIISVSYLCLFCVSHQTKGVVSTAECGGAHGGWKGGGGSYTDRFERMLKIEGKKEGTRSTDFTVQSAVCSCSTGVQNQIKGLFKMS